MATRPVVCPGDPGGELRERGGGRLRRLGAGAARGPGSPGRSWGTPGSSHCGFLAAQGARVFASVCMRSSPG